MEESYEDFLKRIKNVSGPRVHKVSNSSGISAAILFYTKTRPRDPQYVLSRSEFSKVIDSMNLLLVDKLLNDGSFRLPSGLGELRISKRKTATFLDDNGSLVCTKSIDRDKTYKLWYEDSEAMQSKQLVRSDDEYVFRIMHSRASIRSKNAIYYYIKFGRSIKQKLKNKILTDKTFDAYERKRMDQYR